jgi:hypothetical protein
MMNDAGACLWIADELNAVRFQRRLDALERAGA